MCKTIVGRRMAVEKDRVEKDGVEKEGVENDVSICESIIIH